MEKADVTTRIQSVVPDATIQVEGEGCSFTVCVISPVFAGVRPVARQQKVMEGFMDVLQSGEMHALSIKAHTPEEWTKLQQPVTLTL